MLDLNTASVEDIVALGIEPAIARDMAFWGPFRTWEDLLWIDQMNDALLARLQAQGVRIGGGADQAWAAPKPFQLSSPSERTRVPYCDRAMS